MAVLVLFSGQAFSQQDPLRPGATFEQEPKTAPLVNAENNDRKRTRSYAMQPPTIPHKTDNYQVDRFANKCLTCHARGRDAGHADQHHALPRPGGQLPRRRLAAALLLRAVPRGAARGATARR
jgi:nitrate reductase cytochrome c-type subunit